MWMQLAEQLYQDVLQIPFDEEGSLADFAQLQSDLWPKYLQAGLNEMSTELSQTRIKLEKSEFENMAKSWLDNLDDYSLFEDYLASDMIIEVARALKIKAVDLVQQIESKGLDLRDEEKKKEVEFLRKIAIEEFLRDDEFNHYNNLMNNLKLGSKWNTEQTQEYLTKAIGDLE